MYPRRFEGVKIDLDRCTPQELANLEHYSENRLNEAAYELGVLAMYRADHPTNVVPIPTQLTMEYDNGPDAA